MATWLKVVFGVLITFLFGTLVYLFLIYFGVLKSVEKPVKQAETTANTSPSPDNLGTKIPTPNNETIEGLVFCLKDMPKGESLGNCEDFGLVTDDDKVYRLIVSGVKIALFNEKDDVRVVGVVGRDPSPSGPSDGIIIAVEMSKI